jgi:tetratricopeptide (TPR) repeat protein
MRKIVFLLVILSVALVQAQNEALAKNYLQQGQYEKAISIYKNLYKQNPYQVRYLTAMVEGYQQLEDFDTAQKLLKEKLAQPKANPQLYVDLGYNYALQKKDSLATLNYELALEKAKENKNYIYAVGKRFEDYSLLDYAVKIYEFAATNDERMTYENRLARIYGEQGNIQKMFQAYLDLIIKTPRYLNTAQRILSQYITEDPDNEANMLLKKELLKRSQNNPDLIYNELLSWLFVQQKQYLKAFIQEKAIFKRMADNDLSGIRDLAYIAISEKHFDDAKEIIQFLIENATTPAQQLQGEQLLLKVTLETASPKAYDKIDQRYKQLLEKYGSDTSSSLLQLDYAHFLAFKYNKREEAIAMLKALTKQAGLSKFQEAKIKMLLADILVFEEKFNQALIYYSQIQSSLEGDVLAQEARFKIAQTSYFKGDFEWAKVQLDVLKKSYSQLIANDAMQLSFIIFDNTQEDSTQTALKKYAKADLLAYQQKPKEALEVLQDILTQHKGEKIEDEALFKSALMYEQSSQYNKAEEAYLKIITFYKEDILADDALFNLAKLYETKLENPEKAKQFYEQIIFNHQDSIYFLEARKRFRILRGDTIEQ